MVEEVINTSQQQQGAGKKQREGPKKELKHVCLNQLMTSCSDTLNPLLLGETLYFSLNPAPSQGR